MSKRLRWLVIAATCLFPLVAGENLQAGLFQVGSTFTVSITNAPSGANLSAVPVSLTPGTPTLIDNGNLSVSESIIPVSSNQEWIDVSFTNITDRHKWRRPRRKHLCPLEIGS